jgi:hypothetical protein
MPEDLIMTRVLLLCTQRQKRTIKSVTVAPSQLPTYVLSTSQSAFSPDLRDQYDRADCLSTFHEAVRFCDLAERESLGDGVLDHAFSDGCEQSLGGCKQCAAWRQISRRWGGRPSTASMWQGGGVENREQRRRP